MSKRDPEARRLAAILFTDIVGYTALMGRDESAGRRVRERHEALVRPLVARYQGEWVEERGDESLSVFGNARDAVNCALAIQQALADDPELKLRIGVHSGDVTFERGRVIGDGVNVASRIRALAEPGGIFVSGQVYDSIKNQPNCSAIAQGERALKNVAQPVAVYAVTGTAAAPRAAAPRALAVRPHALRWVAGAAFAVALGAMAVALLYFAVTHDWSGKQEPVAPREITSIVVLPLHNLMNDPQQDYFVDGMHEALITELSKIRALKIISRTSAMRYRNAEKSVPEIALELGVDAVVEGSVLRAGNTVRVTAQLIEARSDRHLWADNFDRELSDILALHSDLAQAIVGEIKVAVTPEEESRFAYSDSISPEVYELYLKGRYLCGKWTPEEMASGIRYLQQALEIDPGYAPGYAELASCYTDTSYFEYLPPLEVYPMAKAAAVRAVELDDRLAEAHTALGAVYYQMDWKFLDSEKAFKRAIELNPNNSRTLIYYAWMLGETGRFEEAMVQAQRAQALDPLSVSANVAVAEILYLSRNYDEAIKEYSKNLDLGPNDPAVHYFLAWPYEQKGMFEKAIALLEKAVTLSEGAPVYLAALGHTDALAGKRGEALKILEELQNPSAPMPPSPFHIALVHIGLGNDDSAFQWLEEAFRERALQLIYLKAGPKFDRLRSDPRFDDLLRRLGFPES